MFASETDNYLDICVGRWPVDNCDDVDLMFTKLKLYEWPEDFPEDYARKLLLLGSSTVSGDVDMIELVNQLNRSGAISEYLDSPSELYYPHSHPQGDLDRNNTLAEFDNGYNLIIHQDHSGVHEIGTAAKYALEEVMWGSDFTTMGNTNEPSILWTLGCDPGWFDGADCFSEAGLLTSNNTGLVAVISNSRYGISSQNDTYYAFCDALFNTGWINFGPTSSSAWPLSYLGEAHRCSKNYDDISFLRLNLLGSPLMYVWRDDPGELSITVPPILLREGIPQDITVTVTEGFEPVATATVCLWKKGEIFSVEVTNVRGRVTFEDVCIADGSGAPDVVITAVKRRQGSTVVSYIPDQATIDVLEASIPIVSLESSSVDASGDGTANPGETVDIYLTAKNSGGEIALNVTAELSLVSGGEYIESIPDDQMGFPSIGQDQTEGSTDPFTIVVNSDVASYSTVEFSVLFSYDGNSGSYQWESPLFLTIYSEGYLLTVVEPIAANSGTIPPAPPSVITLSDMFLANCGLGEGSNLEITVDNLNPPATYTVNTLTHSGFGSNEVADLSGEIVLNVNASQDPDWFNKFEGCSFDVVVTSDGGEFIARNVDVEDIWKKQDDVLDPPTGIDVYEIGQDYISLEWEHYGAVDAEGFYVYYDDGFMQYRVFPLPVPVEQATIEDLVPGREYEIEVTAIDAIGRERASDPLAISTTCPLVAGWPLQLEGSPGGGAVIVDIDQDTYDEIVVATSFGFVYIIERDGSYYTLTPPSGYDFDKFLGCAVGDVDGDSQQEIVVSCQRFIEDNNNERVAILLFAWNGLSWDVSQIAETDRDEEVASPPCAGTPVLFQADGEGYLEIALRTKGNFDHEGTPNLYVWRYNQNSDNWINYSNDFPFELSGWIYCEPTAVDFDNDECEELLFVTPGSSDGTDINIADFESNGEVTITTHGLPLLDVDGTATVYGTLAAAEENGDYYIAGAAKEDDSNKRIFVYTLDTNPVGVTFVWRTDWMNGWDLNGVMPGPSIGDIDGDSDLDVIYTLNDGIFNKEGVVYAWDLSDGPPAVFTSEIIKFNPIIGGGDIIKSQPVVGLTTSQISGGMTIFTGFSSYCCGFDPSTNDEMLGGFPSCTRDGAWAAPAICDLNGDNVPEVLYIDFSGYASLFDWDDGYYTDTGWHMYQDNPHRNGFYNYCESDRCGGLDICVTCSYVALETRTDDRCLKVVADVEITGIFSIPAEENTQRVISDSGLETEQTVASVSRSSSSSMIANTSISRILTSNSRPEYSAIPPELSTEAVLLRTVEVAAFCGDKQIGSAIIPLESGSHRIEIPLRPGSYSLEDDIRIVADPFNDYIEVDEANNTSTAENTDIAVDIADVYIPSPAGSIELTLNLPHSISHGLTIRVYSVDGRLVTRYESEDIQAGRTNLLLNDAGEYPTGMYTVCIDGLDTGELVRKVIILND